MSEIVDLPVSTVPETESVDGLLDEVLKTCEQPVNRLQVTAILESAGVTDAIARRRYAYEDVFALADVVAARIRSESRAKASPSALQELPSENWKAALADYARGPLGLLPLVLLTVLINLYQNFGQWDSAQILTLSISTVGSLLITGGFIQVAARKGSSYLSQGYIQAAGRVILQVMIVSVCAIVLSAVLLVVGGRLSGLLDPADQPLMLISYITLSCLWLFSAVLAILDQVHWFGIGLGIGVGCTYAGIRLLPRTMLADNVVMLVATAVGVSIAIAVMMVVIHRTLLQRRAASPVGDHRAVLAPLPQLLVNLAPYFVYGVTYILFVLAGHVGGWVGRLPEGVDRIQGMALSELTLTVALTGYILVGGVAESTMRRFWERVNHYQKASLAGEPESFSGTLRTFVRKERARFVWALVICSGLVLLVVAGGVLASTERRLLGLEWRGPAMMIFLSGLTGYGMLALGVFDCMFSITLSRPIYALKALAVGTIVTLVSSVAVGLLVSYAYGVFGIVAGSFVFILVARHYVSHIIVHADFYYFSSF